MKNYYFIGIKGSGMSSLAQILHDLGHNVQGSDTEDFIFTETPLHQRGIKILPFNISNITSDFIYIAGNAFSDNHIEIKKAMEIGAEVIRYHDFLSNFLSQFTSIAISGTHGKTSTTGLLSHVLNHLSPSNFLIGDGTGFGSTESQHFTFEACEYKRHFTHYKPDYAIITNIEWDHPDYFQSLEDVISAFQTFSNGVKKAVLVFGDDKNTQKITHHQKITYGFSKTNDLYASNIQTDQNGTYFDSFYKNTFIERVFINRFGNHHILNTLATIGILLLDDISISSVLSSFGTFNGVKRRFTEIKSGDFTIVDDYAHHPTEIKATIESARLKYPDKEIVAIFQPHTFTRTQTFLNEFAESLSLSDTVYLCDIFGSAREKKGDLTTHDLSSLIPNCQVLEIDSIDELLKHENNILLFMGAGDITKYEEALFEKLNTTLSS